MWETMGQNNGVSLDTAIVGKDKPGCQRLPITMDLWCRQCKYTISGYFWTSDSVVTTLMGNQSSKWGSGVIFSKFVYGRGI